MERKAEQFARLVIRPVLKHLKMHSPAAERLVLGTALTESGLDYIEQIGGGPALGYFQMEPATVEDIYKNFLRYRPSIRIKVGSYEMPLTVALAVQLPGNAYLGAALCRVHYWRVPAALPAVDDTEGLARYWKDHYNTHLGAGQPEHFVRALVSVGA